MEPRWYQEEAITAGLNSIYENRNPVVVLPTGAGKTLVLAGIIERFMMEHPTERILVLSHVEEILKQNYNTVTNWIGDIVGLYSAGLGHRNNAKIVTIAGIQSIYQLDYMDPFFDKVGLIIVDECHLVNVKDTGMYRNVINRTKANVLGLTATPFRTGHGYIFIGDGVLFNDLAYDAGDFETYNRLVREGYLSKIISKNTEMRLDTTGVSVTAGDYNQTQLAEQVDRDSITETAIEEVIRYGKKYKKWLFFAINIEHAEHIKKSLTDKGIPTGIVHSKMEGDRRVELAMFHSGKYRAIVNVDVLTTGFDEPGIDLIAMLRPTMSPIIHVQTVGRGARVAEGKDHCLFLDFAGNTERLGPINDIKVKQRGAKQAATGDPITKTCPECDCVHHPSVKICDGCGYEFQFKTKLTKSSSHAAPVREDKEMLKRWVDVDSIRYSIYSKPGKTDSLRVQYTCGMNTFSEWIAYKRPNYGGRMAENWVRWRWPKGELLPDTIGELYTKSDKLLVPKRIYVDASEKFARILNCEF